jgi:hypothetical protein
LKEGYISEYDKHQSTGWRGPYMKAPNGMIDATYFDSTGFPETRGNHVYLDALLTPWAKDCEDMAAEAEKEGQPELAREYRKGKYYQVFYPQLIRTSPVWGEHTEDDTRKGYVVDWEPPTCEIPRDSSFIVSRGPDCLPPDAPKTDLAVLLACIARMREEALSPEACGKISSRIALAGSVAGLRECVKEEVGPKLPECFDDGKSAPLEQRLSIKQRENPYYIDIGDDLVMSLTGKTVRSPLDN